VVAVGVLVPAGQTAELDVGLGQADAHVAVAALAYDLDLVVVDAACWRDHVVGAYGCRVFVRFAGSFNKTKMFGNLTCITLRDTRDMRV